MSQAASVILRSALLRATLASLLCLSALAAQQPTTILTATVADAKGSPVAGVAVQLVGSRSHTTRNGVTDAAGTVLFRDVAREPSVVTATAPHTQATVDVSVAEASQTVHLVLMPSAAAIAPGGMEFSDAPEFTVAGVTDWTAVGGHGSDATLRTSESLANATAGLTASATPDAVPAEESRLQAAVRDAVTPTQRAAARRSVQAALSVHPTASLYRLAGEADEASGDSLSAVQEFAQAASLSPSEANEFAWGSELLRHRAILQALEVFSQAAASYPDSVRMQAALGTAMFAAARYEEAAAQLCKASDLAPQDAEPYRFMGRAELASPNALPCVDAHLARYAQMYPASAEAHYLYAMAILKRGEQAPDARSTAQAESLLHDAVALDAGCGEAYLELGVLAAQRNDASQAITEYTKAVKADPKLADAYYRLAKAYARAGDAAQAKAAFATHSALIQANAAETEQQRKAVKQFLFAVPGNAPAVPGNAPAVPGSAPAGKTP